MPRALVPLAAGCEELEAVTIIDLLRRAKVEVVTASLEAGPVHCSRGVVLLADRLLDEVMEEDFDLLALPGGLPGADNLNADARIHRLINRLAATSKQVAAICAAPKVLVENGIMNGKMLTAYPGSLDAVNTSEVSLTDSPVVQDGRITTSRGPGAAMDFALQLIENLQGRAVREQVEAGLCRP